MKKKVVLTLGGIMIVLTLFSFTGNALAERIDFSMLPHAVQAFMGKIIALNPAGPGESPRYYDVLVKKQDTGSGSGAYRAGDVVAVRPYGHEWSHNEKNSFWIVKMYLTETQIQALTAPKEEPVPEEELEDDEYQEMMRMISRRELYIPPEVIEQLKAGGIMPKNVLRER